MTQAAEADKKYVTKEDSHTHNNKSTLDTIDNDTVALWNKAVQSIGGLTTTRVGTQVNVTTVPTNLLSNVAGETLIMDCGTSNTVI